MRSFDELVAEFIATPKKVVRKPRWRTKNHPDFATLTLDIMVEGRRHLRGRIAVSAHRLIWLHEFLVLANVTCNYRVAGPPRGRQLDFPYDTGPIAR